MNRQTVIDLLAAGRVANLPSVVSNVVLGAVVTAATIPGAELSLIGPALAGCGLYLGGCFLNDWHDQSWDQEHKPSRALPSGRLGSSSVLLLAVTSFALGLILAFFHGWLAGGVAIAIVVAILVYTKIHKKTVWGILPMGCCRGGLYFLGLSAQGGEPHFLLSLVGAAIGLASYVAGLSLLARYEAGGTLGRWHKGLAILLLLLPGLLLFWYSIPSGLLGLLFFGVIAGFGQRLLRRGISHGVSFFLAGISLVDFGVLVTVALVTTSSALWPYAIASLFAFLVALLLQRIAPAT